MTPTRGLGLLTCLLVLSPAARAASDPLPPARTDAHGDELPAGARLRVGTTRLRHGKGVNSLAFSPDSRLIASASPDSTVRIWDAATGKEKFALVGHTAPVTSVAFAPDGKRLASGGKDNTVRVWDAGTGKEERVVKDVPGQNFNQVNSVVFSPDGKTLAASGNEDWVGLWEVETGKRTRLLAEARGQDIYFGDFCDILAFADGGKTLVAGGRLVRAWDVATGKKVRQWPAQDWGGCVAVAPDGTTLAVKGYNPRIQLWDLAAGKKLRPIKGSEVGGAVAFAPDGKTLAEGGMAGAALWDVTTGKMTRRFDMDDGVQSLAFSPDGKVLAAGCTDHSVHIWDLATGKEVGPAAEHSSMVVAVAAAPRGKALAAAWRQVIYLGDPAAGLRRFAEQDDRVTCLAFSPDEKLLASGGDAGTVCVWDVATGKRVHQLIDADDRTVFVQFTSDGKTLVAGNENFTFHFWDAATGKLLRHVKDEKRRDRAGFNGPAPALALSPDGKAVALAAEGEAVRLLDAATGKELKNLQAGKEDERRDHNVTGLAFSPDGALLAVATQERAVRLWDVAEGKLVREWKEEEKKEKEDDDTLVRRGDESYAVAFSPDGRTLATWFTDRSMRYAFWNDNAGRTDSTVRLWETATGKERRRLKGHRGGVVCVAFAADGRSVATGSEDTTLLVWDTTGADAARPLSPADLEDAWAALGSEDAARALKAIGTLAAAPADAVPFVQQKLKPVAPADPKRLEQLIADLESNQFAARKKATDELERCGEQAEGALRKALKGDPSPETKKRLDELLAKLDKGRRSLSSDQLRVVRALEALELANTAEARQALTKLASGVAEAWQTREAKAALDRSNRRAGS